MSKPAATGALMSPGDWAVPFVDDCDLTIVKSRIVVCRYGDTMEPKLYGAVWIFPDEASGFDPSVETYSIGSLEHHQPSISGADPVTPDGRPDLDVHWEALDDPASGEGFWALGSKKISPSSTFALFCNHLFGCGVPHEHYFKFVSDKGADVRWMEGIRGHVNRVSLGDKAIAYAREKHTEKGGKSGDFREPSALVLTSFDSIVTDLSGMLPVEIGGGGAIADTSEVEGKLDELIVYQLTETGGRMERNSFVNLITGSKKFDRSEKGVALNLLMTGDYEDKPYELQGQDLVLN